MPEFELPNLGGRLMSTQVSMLLMRELREGCFSDCERLPSEVELAERMHVSRTVIRDALSDLEREGFIERVRGIGTVINREIVRLGNRLDLKVEYNDLISASGAHPHTDSISVRIEPAGEKLAESLQLAPEDPVIVCEKRLLADARPVIYSIDYLPKALFADVSHTDLDWSLPIFDLLDRFCGIIILTSIARVHPTNAAPDVRKKLAVADGDALLLLDEVGYSKLSRPIMHSYEYYTDFFDFTLLRKKF